MIQVICFAKPHQLSNARVPTVAVENVWCNIVDGNPIVIHISIDEWNFEMGAQYSGVVLNVCPDGQSN